MPEPRPESFPEWGLFKVMFSEMERLLHCNQGFIANSVLTLNSELLYVCSRSLALELRSQHARLRTPDFSHPSTFGRQALIVCSTAEFSRQKVYFPNLRRNSQ